MTSAKLTEVIRDYLSDVKKGISLFEREIGKTPPLTAWKNKELPQQGELSNGIKYQFHGIGCLLFFPNYEVDFDFGPNNRSDGFDLWRLTQYVSSREDKYSSYKNTDKLKKDFENAIESAMIYKLDHPYCNLYFLH